MQSVVGGQGSAREIGERTGGECCRQEQEDGCGDGTGGPACVAQCYSKYQSKSEVSISTSLAAPLVWFRF